MRKNPTILITNDDGIQAPGLKVLEKIAAQLSDDIWVVAPEVEQSGAGHSLTINSPMRYRKVSARRFAVSGTPTDCVLMATCEIIPEKVDLVLSGVNRSKNIGEDVTHSGTVAGALEGTLCGIRSIALSQSMDFMSPDAKVHWKTAEEHGPKLIRKLLTQEWEPDTLFNVNFPDCASEKVKGIKCVAHGKRHVPKQLTKNIDPKGRPYFWLNWPEEGADPRRPDCDIEWLRQDYITVTPICLDMTNYNLLKRLKNTLEK
ncbi:MAG TPA: 5'/3'-nucleotidase SurE [Rickettsiales bacterium]|nr:5'/3'-nucleotidase SurE [Rickettsiales bacterium]